MFPTTHAKFRAALVAYGGAVLISVAFLVARIGMGPTVTEGRPLLILFVVPIALSAYVGGGGPGLLATALLGIGADYFILAPHRNFGFATSADMEQWALFVANGALISLLSEFMYRAQRREAKAGEGLRLAEQASRASERLYRLIFEESPLAKWVYDPETLRFMAVNRTAQALYGYTEAEFLAMSLRDIRPAEDVPALEKDVAAPRVGGPNRSEWRHRRKDGRVIDVVVHAHEIALGDRRARLAVVQDITEQKHAEEKMRAQLARLDLLHRITRAIGERQDLDSIFQVVVRSLEENLPIDLCCLCVYDPAIPQLTVARVGVRSEALVMQLALPEHSNIPIDPNGLSRCVRGLLVYEPDTAAIPFPFPQRLASADLRSVVFAPLLVESQVFGVLIAARHAANTFSSADCEFLRQLSEHVGLAANQAQLYGALQHAYEDLRQTQQLIVQQERLRSLGQMASGIAHDINNAISPAALYAETLLEQEAGLSASGREKLATIQHALDDVAQTVARMREFYRPREPQLDLTPIDVVRLLQQVRDLTRARWHDLAQQRGIAVTVKMEVASGLPPILGAESEIRDALTNLVFNAVDAMPEGGVLLLRALALEPRPESRRGREVEIAVIDTGVGMDAETRLRCVEPFFTTKGERGTGLGLAMVYGMAQRHGADLQIESERGRGTTVRLAFAVAPAAGASAPEQAGKSGPIPRLRLLVIDDDPLLIKSLRDTLEADGHVVVAANGGQSGIDAFLAGTAAKEPFAAVITDLGMPHVDGRKVARAIKSASPATPVILLTGWGQRLAAGGDAPEHVDLVLAKPPKIRELRAALTTYRAP